MLAEITAVRRVGLIVRIADFVGADEFVRNRKLFDYRESVLSLEIGVTRTFAGHRQGSVAEFIGGGVCKIGAVNAAGEGDYHRSHLTQDAAKFLLFEMEGRRDWGAERWRDRCAIERFVCLSHCLSVPLSHCPAVSMSLHLCFTYNE